MESTAAYASPPVTIWNSAGSHPRSLPQIKRRTTGVRMAPGEGNLMEEKDVETTVEGTASKTLYLNWPLEGTEGPPQIWLSGSDRKRQPKQVDGNGAGVPSSENFDTYLFPSDAKNFTEPDEQEKAPLSKPEEDSIEFSFQIMVNAEIAASVEKANALLGLNRMLKI